MENLLIAVPSNNPGGIESELAGHFGHCDVFTLVKIEDGKVADVSTLQSMPHEQGGCMAPGQTTSKTGYGRNRQFCTLILGKRLFGVDILDVKEISPNLEFTPVFHAPREIVGYVNIRGAIHLILDLRLLMGFESTRTDEWSRLVLFKPNVGESFGVLVDRVGDVVEVDESYIEDRRKSSKEGRGGVERRKSDLGSGVCKLDDELMVILNSRNLFNHIGNRGGFRVEKS